MEWQTILIDCADHFPETNRNDPFSIVIVTFNYQGNADDKEFLDKVIVKGHELAEMVHTGAANDATHNRSKKRVIKNCVAGVIAEQLWKMYLNKDKPVVTETEYIGAAAQIDLLIIGVYKKVEVRSSFPRNSIEFAICHKKYQFDILGPYANSYKPAEIEKDYYVRTLFHLPAEEYLSQKIKSDKFEVVLAGGATWGMMADNNIAIVKTLIPEDELEPLRLGEATNYRVVPYSKALDTLQIYDLITSES